MNPLLTVVLVLASEIVWSVAGGPGVGLGLGLKPSSLVGIWRNPGSSGFVVKQYHPSVSYINSQFGAYRHSPATIPFIPHPLGPFSVINPGPINHFKQPFPQLFKWNGHDHDQKPVYKRSEGEFVSASSLDPFHTAGFFNLGGFTSALRDDDTPLYLGGSGVDFDSFAGPGGDIDLGSLRRIEPELDTLSSIGATTGGVDTGLALGGLGPVITPPRNLEIFPNRYDGIPDNFELGDILRGLGNYRGQVGDGAGHPLQLAGLDPQLRVGTGLTNANLDDSGTKNSDSKESSDSKLKESTTAPEEGAKQGSDGVRTVVSELKASSDGIGSGITTGIKGNAGATETDISGLGSKLGVESTGSEKTVENKDNNLGEIITDVKRLRSELGSDGVKTGLSTANKENLVGNWADGDGLGRKLEPVRIGNEQIAENSVKNSGGIGTITDDLRTNFGSGGVRIELPTNGKDNNLGRIADALGTNVGLGGIGAGAIPGVAENLNAIGTNLGGLETKPGSIGVLAGLSTGNKESQGGIGTEVGGLGENLGLGRVETELTNAGKDKNWGEIGTNTDVLGGNFGTGRVQSGLPTDGRGEVGSNVGGLVANIESGGAYNGRDKNWEGIKTNADNLGKIFGTGIQTEQHTDGKDKKWEGIGTNTNLLGANFGVGVGTGLADDGRDKNWGGIAGTNTDGLGANFASGLPADGRNSNWGGIGTNVGNLGANLEAGEASNGRDKNWEGIKTNLGGNWDGSKTNLDDLGANLGLVKFGSGVNTDSRLNNLREIGADVNRHGTKLGLGGIEGQTNKLKGYHLGGIETYIGGLGDDLKLGDATGTGFGVANGDGVNIGGIKTSPGVYNTDLGGIGDTVVPNNVKNISNVDDLKRGGDGNATISNAQSGQTLSKAQKSADKLSTTRGRNIVKSPRRNQSQVPPITSTNRIETTRRRKPSLISATNKNNRYKNTVTNSALSPELSAYSPDEPVNTKKRPNPNTIPLRSRRPLLSSDSASKEDDVIITNSNIRSNQNQEASNANQTENLSINRNEPLTKTRQKNVEIQINDFGRRVSKIRVPDEERLGELEDKPSIRREKFNKEELDQPGTLRAGNVRQQRPDRVNNAEKEQKSAQSPATSGSVLPEFSDIILGNRRNKIEDSWFKANEGNERLESESEGIAKVGATPPFNSPQLASPRILSKPIRFRNGPLVPRKKVTVEQKASTLEDLVVSEKISTVIMPTPSEPFTSVDVTFENITPKPQNEYPEVKVNSTQQPLAFQDTTITDPKLPSERSDFVGIDKSSPSQPVEDYKRVEQGPGGVQQVDKSDPKKTIGTQAPLNPPKLERKMEKLQVHYFAPNISLDTTNPQFFVESRKRRLRKLRPIKEQAVFGARPKVTPKTTVTPTTESLDSPTESTVVMRAPVKKFTRLQRTKETIISPPTTTTTKPLLPGTSRPISRGRSRYQPEAERTLGTSQKQFFTKDDGEASQRQRNPGRFRFSDPPQKQGSSEVTAVRRISGSMRTTSTVVRTRTGFSGRVGSTAF